MALFSKNKNIQYDIKYKECNIHKYKECEDN